MPTEVKTILKRVDTYGPKPKTGVEALRQAHALLKEEGRWCTGELFTDGDPAKVFKNGSLCGAWSACAAGALGMVTGELEIGVQRYWETTEVDLGAWQRAAYLGDTELGYKEWAATQDPERVTNESFQWNNTDIDEGDKDSVIYKAARALAGVILADYGEDEQIDGYSIDTPFSVIYAFNDHLATRDDVLKVFKKAIKAQTPKKAK